MSSMAAGAIAGRGPGADDMAYAVTFEVGARSDQWLRNHIAGGGPGRPAIAQIVLVDSFADADRLVAAMAMAKYRAGRPYGGAMIERVANHG